MGVVGGTGQAEKNGVAWRDTAAELEKTQAVYSQFDQLEVRSPLPMLRSLLTTHSHPR